MATVTSTTKGPDKSVVVASIYTLSPLHCGSGEPDDVVDLPIQRERHTGYPVIPGTSLKGGARAAMERVVGEAGKKLVFDLFGPEPKKMEPNEERKGDKGKKDEKDKKDNELYAGELVFSEARLVLFPLPACHVPYVYVTSYEVLNNFVRDLRALGLGDQWTLGNLAGDTKQALLSNKSLPKGGITIDDLGYGPDQVVVSGDAGNIAKELAKLVSETESDTRARIVSRLVVVPNHDFHHFVKTGTQVAARIKLNTNKTTGGGEHGGDEGGNLWYEETVPPEALFVAFVRARTASSEKLFDEWIWRKAGAEFTTQIGGNETVGQGLALWYTALAGRGGV